MFSRAAVRATQQVAGRRAFHATRSQMSSPYHYAEGPYTNIPFDPKKKGFPILFWGYCITGFSAPFLIAGSSYNVPRDLLFAQKRLLWLIICVYSVSNLQAQGISCQSGLLGGGRSLCVILRRATGTRGTGKGPRG